MDDGSAEGNELYFDAAIRVLALNCDAEGLMSFDADCCVDEGAGMLLGCCCCEDCCCKDCCCAVELLFFVGIDDAAVDAELVDAVEEFAVADESVALVAASPARRAAAGSRFTICTRRNNFCLDTASLICCLLHSK